MVSPENQLKKDKYHKVCEMEKEVPIFLTCEWLDVVGGANGWDVVLCEKGGQIIGALTYYHKKKAGFHLLSHPPLTPYLGPWIKYPKDQKYTNQLSHNIKVANALIDQLPRFDAFVQCFYPTATNWLPFYWKGYSQTTRYTYIIHDTLNHKKIFENFRENIRREIRKVEKLLHILIREEVDLLYQLNDKFYTHNSQKVPFTYKTLEDIYQLTQQKQCGKLYFAEDQQGNTHAGILVIWDSLSAYYLVGASDPNFKTSGALSLLLWTAIKDSAAHVKAFNFEGSMIEPVERYFRAFGGIQTPYLQISKTNSKALKLRDFLTE